MEMIIMCKAYALHNDITTTQLIYAIYFSLRASIILLLLFLFLLDLD